MRLQVLFLLALPWILIEISRADQIRIAKTGCKDRCGNISIPYPFGIGHKCYHNHWFDVKCSKDQKLSLVFHGIHVRNISNIARGHERTLVISTDVVELCSDETLDYLQAKTYILSGSPFLFASERNVLLVGGCGSSVAMVDRKHKVVAGCAAVCLNDSKVPNNCDGIGCCQANMGDSLDQYSFKFIDSTNVSTCVPTALVDSSSIINKAIDSNLSSFDPAPTVLEWRVQTLPVQSPSYANSTCEYKALSSADAAGYVCRCKADFYQGNPYLPYGCQVIKECESCIQDCTPYGNKTYGCPNTRKTKSTIAIALGVGISIGSVVLLLGAYWFYRLLKKRKDSRLKAKYFERNGGLLLKHHLSSEDDSFEKVKIFNSYELEKATDGYNESRILGQGGQGTVFKGMLSDGKIVAIKKFTKVGESQLNVIINEVVLLSQINDRNVVKLLGCCLETEVPLLVYEYVPNGTLAQHIHNPNEEFPITWEMRLQIAADTANALAYMHSSSWMPILHRDIKSSNILLDNKYRAKLSDFGISKSMAMDQTHITTRVVGTFGYLDPEYFRSNQFTDKSDVYSFGVVLVELLTGQKPVRSVEDEQRGLVPWFLSFMENDSLDDILDARIPGGGNEEVVAIANLAKRCLDLDGKRRPSMKEIAAELGTIRSAQQVLRRNPAAFTNLSDETSISMTRTFSMEDEV